MSGVDGNVILYNQNLSYWLRYSNTTVEYLI